MSLRAKWQPSAWDVEPSPWHRDFEPRHPRRAARFSSSASLTMVDWKVETQFKILRQPKKTPPKREEKRQHRMPYPAPLCLYSVLSSSPPLFDEIKNTVPRRTKEKWIRHVSQVSDGHVLKRRIERKRGLHLSQIFLTRNSLHGEKPGQSVVTKWRKRARHK